jgi:hypothetical protein
MDEIRLYLALKAQLEMEHPVRPNDDFLFTTWHCPVEIKMAWWEQTLVVLADAIIDLCEKVKHSIQKQSHYLYTQKVG